MESSIKILVCYHKPDVLLKDDIFVPIHVGRALAKQRLKANDDNLQWLLNNTIGDDTGDNISHKNASYNELTALYWAWKNYDKLGNPDYIGLMHYRRHFIFREGYNVVEEVPEISSDYYDYINYKPHVINSLLQDCDYIAHIGRVDCIYNHYKENHHIEDLDLAIKIMCEKYPKFRAVARKYLQKSYGNFFNMFVLPKKLFFDYCQWLFDILSAFEEQVDLSEKRLFISERLTGIYMAYLKSRGFKQKSLPATFIRAQSHTPIALPFYQSDKLKLSVVMSSILKHADNGSYVDFYLLHNDNDSVDIHCMDSILQGHEGNTITFVNVNEQLRGKYDISKLVFPEHYPLVLAEVLPKLGKVLYLNENALFFGDIAHFYQECNNDEFYVLTPIQQGELLGGVYSINCNRLRQHKMLARFIELSKGQSALEIFKAALGKKQLWHIPKTLVTVAIHKASDEVIYGEERCQQSASAWYKPLLYFCQGEQPWLNIQGVYAHYWWEIAKHIPAPLCDLSMNTDAYKIMESQLRRLVDENKRYVKLHTVADKPVERKTSVVKKALLYYKKHGMIATCKKIIKKLLRIK